MRKVIFMIGISLDGYFEGPDREIDWHMVDAELHQHFNDELANAGAFMDGRVTSELMSAYWPTADQEPDAAPQEKEFARIWRETPKYIYSKTLQSSDWGETILREVVPADIEAMKTQPGGDIYIGGPNLAATFARLNLIDEYRIYVHPILIGEGHPIFAADLQQTLRLIDTRTFGNGVVLLRYEPIA